MDVMFYEVFKEEREALKNFLPAKLKVGFTSKAISASDAGHLLSTLISVRTQSKIPLVWANDLRGILTRSTGYDHLLEYRKRTRPGILCGYLGDYCARAVGEQAVLMAVALLRRLKRQINHFDQFNRDDITGGECQGRKLLVVGVGSIGAEIVDVGRGLRMDVKGVDLDHRLRNLDYVSLARGVRWADVIICALPLTEKTGGMLNYAVLQKARPGLILVNVSRGEISPLNDLGRLLKEGILDGVGLDVFEEEPQLAEALRGKRRKTGGIVKTVLALKGRDNVIFTPHNAFNTQESVERKARLAAESIVTFLAKGRFVFPVPRQ